METTRERIIDLLREQSMTPTELADETETTPDAVVEHVRHIARSLTATDEELLVAPPQCHDCGFEDFDDRANRPSRCPSCKSEVIEDPLFTIP